MNAKYVIKSSDGNVIVDDVMVATHTIDRMRGLMFRDEMPSCKGFLIDPCNSIHTFFMRFDLDIAFMSKENEIVALVREMKPWRLTKLYFKSRKVLEMRAGTMPEYFQVGRKVNIECIK